MPLAIGAQGVNSGLRGQATNRIALAAGASYRIPNGSWQVRLGPYTTIQQYDPVMNFWRAQGDDGVNSGSIGGGPMRYINSDGVNFRVVNQTGCAVGALITNAGSAYTSAPTATPSAGSSVWACIVGGAVNTTVTITSGGSLYTYAPILVVEAPPIGAGFPATATCTISGGLINAVTVTNQGAGYVTPPRIFVVPDPRDTTGKGAILTTTLTGAGTVTGMYVTDHGNAVTSIPTLTFSGGGGSSAAATVIMCWTITAYTVVTAGTSYIDAPLITGVGGFPATAAIYTNPATQRALVRERKASIRAALATGTLTATGQVVDDGGIYAGVPTALVWANENTGTTPSGINFTVGGASDSFELWAA